MPPTPEMQGVVIEPKVNGPYLVRGLGNLNNSRGVSLPTKAVIALCRCGGSQNKPFCDGTHAKKGFSSENLSNERKDKRVDYVGEQITIHDNRSLCSHAGACTDSLRAVFSSKNKPWIDPNGAKTSAVIETIQKCPSGALSYSIGDVEYRDQEREPTIIVAKDGPYYVTGGIDLKDVPPGDGASTEHYALCRCGGSKNKPFCDGTHWNIDFKDEKN